MKLSIITVCYNCVRNLSNTILSILQQKHGNFEYLVIDGNSHDGTQELLHHCEQFFGPRLRWISERDKGIYDAMNKGLQMATGDVIGFLNADDVYHHPAVLDTIDNTLSQHPEADAVHANLDFINEQGDVTRHWAGQDYRPGAFQRGWMPAHPTFYCRRKCFEQFGTFDCNAGTAADFELMLRFIEKHHIQTCYIPEKLIEMRRGGVSTSGIRAIIRNTRLNQRAFRKNGIPYPWHYPITRMLSKISFFTRETP